MSNAIFNKTRILLVNCLMPLSVFVGDGKQGRFHRRIGGYGGEPKVGKGHINLGYVRDETNLDEDEEVWFLY